MYFSFLKSAIGYLSKSADIIFGENFNSNLEHAGINIEKPYISFDKVCCFLHKTLQNIRQFW
jgi:hypothetical protein